MNSPRMSKWLCCTVLLTLPALLPLAAGAEMRPVINYQGVVEIEGGAYYGPAWFKFAICDASMATYYWANAPVAAGQPGTAVELNMSNGFFNVLLGDTTITNMAALPPALFSLTQDLYLAVWFAPENGAGGPAVTGNFAQFGAPQLIAPVPTALNAGYLAGNSYQDIINASTNAAIVQSYNNFTNLFLFRAGDTCTGELVMRALEVQGTATSQVAVITQARAQQLLVSAETLLETNVTVNGTLQMAGQSRAYFGANNYLAANTNGNLTIYKNNQAVFEIE
jgi:hypothetical protein